MKLLISAALALTGLGFGSWGLCSDGAAKAASNSCSSECDATVTCTPQGTCLIECTGPNGQTCEIELECDGNSCQVVGTDCSGPCESAGAPSTEGAKASEPSSSECCAAPCSAPCGGEEQVEH